jgi:hypothetical protein
MKRLLLASSVLALMAGTVCAAPSTILVDQNNNQVGTLTNPIAISNGEAQDTTGTFTNATQTTAVANSMADGYATGLVSIHGTYGTASGGFFVSDDNGTTFYPVICTRSDGSGAESGYTALTNISRQWSCPVGGNDTIEVLSSAVASGTVNVRVGVSTPTTNTGVNIPNSQNYTDIATGTTTVVKSGAGFLHTITVNTYVASATIKIYDNTAGSGTTIANIALPSTITGDAPTTLTYDVGFSTGLTIVTSGATDVTATWR